MSITTSPTAAGLAPHLSDIPLVTSRRGQFWIPGDAVETPHGTFQAGPMYVAWEAPPEVTQPYPVVLVHGGGGQGSEWLGTPDGKPGWAAHFVDAGFATYVVDRPGHGRSPYQPDILGPMGPPAPYEAVIGLFTPPDRAAKQTQWPYGREIGSPEIAQVLAGCGPLPADLAASQELDAARLTALLDRIGPAVVVTHSAGAPAGWLVMDRAPDQVVAVAAVEPLGPPFGAFPGIGALDWGITAAPLGYGAGFADAEQAKQADPDTLDVPAFAGKPVAVFTASASAFRDFAPAMVQFLATAGAQATWIDLEQHGITGNGHGLIFEANADRTVRPVIDWIAGLDRSTPIVPREER